MKLRGAWNILENLRGAAKCIMVYREAVNTFKIILPQIYISILCQNRIMEGGGQSLFYMFKGGLWNCSHIQEGPWKFIPSHNISTPHPPAIIVNHSLNLTTLIGGCLTKTVSRCIYLRGLSQRTCTYKQHR